jgi:hypothetical protein
LLTKHFIFNQTLRIITSDYHQRTLIAQSCLSLELWMTGSGFCGAFDTSTILVLLLWILIVEAVREVSFWVGWR